MPGHNPTKRAFGKTRYGVIEPLRPTTGERRVSNLYGASSVSKFATKRDRINKSPRRLAKLNREALKKRRERFPNHSRLPRAVTKHGELHRHQLRALRPADRERWNDGFVGASGRPFSKLVNTHGEYVEPLKYYDSGVIRYRRFPKYPHGAKSAPSAALENANSYFPSSPRRRLGESAQGIVRTDVPGKTYVRDLVRLREQSELRAPELLKAAGLHRDPKPSPGLATGRDWLQYRKAQDLKTPFRRTRAAVDTTIKARKDKSRAKKSLAVATKTVRRISERANNQHAFGSQRTLFGVSRMKHLSHCTVLRTTAAVGVDTREQANMPAQFEDGNVTYTRQRREQWARAEELLALCRRGGKARSIAGLLRFVDRWCQSRFEEKTRVAREKARREEEKEEKRWALREAALRA
jgi:hypothetical protein